MPLRFTENPRRGASLNVTRNPRVVLRATGLVEASLTDALAGASQNRYISPLRLAQVIQEKAVGDLTRTNDTNVTLTLGGAPTDALFNDISLTLGWTGQLAISRGGTGLSNLGTGVQTWLGTPSSANLAAAITDETGSGALVFATSPTVVTPAFTSPATSPGTSIASFSDGNRDSFTIYTNGDGIGYNAANAIVKMREATGTGRSINAAGTFNASGADYAEYEFKRDDCGIIQKGAIVGFDENGLLTDKWSLAIQFGIKSTAPAFVGGDAWGREDCICPIDGLPIGPEPKCDPEPQARDEEMAASEAFKLLHQEWCNRKAEWETAHRVWFDRLEAARARVDRIAYAGKVPVNVDGAKPGNFIEAMAGVDDSIGGRPSDIETSNTVGRVLSIGGGGRPIVRIT